MTVERFSSESRFEPVSATGARCEAGRSSWWAARRPLAPTAISSARATPTARPASSPQLRESSRPGQRRAGRRHPDALYVTDIAQWEEVDRAHGEVFGKSRPVTAMVEVSGLIDPRMLVEVEATTWTGGGP